MFLLSEEEIRPCTVRMTFLSQWGWHHLSHRGPNTSAEAPGTVNHFYIHESPQTSHTLTQLKASDPTQGNNMSASTNTTKTKPTKRQTVSILIFTERWIDNKSFTNRYTTYFDEKWFLLKTVKDVTDSTMHQEKGRFIHAGDEQSHPALQENYRIFMETIAVILQSCETGLWFDWLSRFHVNQWGCT